MSRGQIHVFEDNLDEARQPNGTPGYNAKDD